MNLYIVLVLFVTILDYHCSAIRPPIPMKYPTTYLQGNMPALQKASCQKDPTHIMCKPLYEPLDNCTEFELLALNNDRISSILIGLNGFRTREVTQEYYQIANMNLLYWDPDLAEMAQQYVLRCDLSGVGDLTKYIGAENYTIGQTYYFSKIYGFNKWYVEPISGWYINYADDNNLDQFSPSAKFTQYTQIIWPKSQFVGCAGASMEQGLLFVCYFGPAANKTNIASGYLPGKPCTECEPLYLPCSNRFPDLCGMDLVGLGNRSNVHFLLIGFVSLRVSISSLDAIQWLLLPSK